MLTAYLLTFLFIICLTLGIYLFSYAVKYAPVFYVIALEIFFGLLLMTLILLFAENLSFTELFLMPDKNSWLWLGAAAVTGFIAGHYFSYLNLKTAGERINSLLSPAITASVILASFFFLNDELTWTKGLGFTITLLAILIFLIFKTNKKDKVLSNKIGFTSGIATIICFTLYFIFSIKGTMNAQLSIMHSLWLRLLIALPFIFILFIYLKPKLGALPKNNKLYLIILAGVIIQTILASYLWFYCTYIIGISTFQIMIATLPFFVYATDVFIFKKNKFSPYFLITALAAFVGIWISMW